MGDGVQADGAQGPEAALRPLLAALAQPHHHGFLQLGPAGPKTAPKHPKIGLKSPPIPSVFGFSPKLAQIPPFLTSNWDPIPPSPPQTPQFLPILPQIPHFHPQIPPFHPKFGPNLPISPIDPSVSPQIPHFHPQISHFTPNWTQFPLPTPKSLISTPHPHFCPPIPPFHPKPDPIPPSLSAPWGTAALVGHNPMGGGVALTSAAPYGALGPPAAQGRPPIRPSAPAAELSSEPGAGPPVGSADGRPGGRQRGLGGKWGEMG